MKSLGKVVWQDGMHLSQHHFQAQSRYFEELIHLVAISLAPESYGVAGVTFDEEALKNDAVSLVHARGIMPDGVTFDFPRDSPPPARRIRDVFSPTQDAHVVLLCIPPFADGRANVASDAAAPDGARYTSTVRPVADEMGDLEEKPIAVALKNFRLLLDAEDTSGLVTLPLGRVRRDGAGHFVYDDEFIPPSLHVGASPALTTLLGRLIEQLTHRAELLRRSGSPGDEELVGRWMAHAIHENLGPLLHLYRTRQAHPSELFRVMSRLAGSLCTFSLNLHPRDLPTYDHARPERPFMELSRQIHDVLEIAAPSSTVVLPLSPAEESFFTAEVTDPRCVGRSQWFLAVRSASEPGELPGRVPRLVNICSAKHIRRLVREAIPGLTLAHVVTPPAGVSPRPGTTYFSIATSGPCWSSIQETREVGIYVPAALAGAALELVIVLGD